MSINPFFQPVAIPSNNFLFKIGQEIDKSNERMQHPPKAYSVIPVEPGSIASLQFSVKELKFQNYLLCQVMGIPTKNPWSEAIPYLDGKLNKFIERKLDKLG